MPSFDAKRIVRLLELRKVGRLMKWEDIEVGEIYHMPPLIYNGRFDFIVLSKQLDTIKVKRCDKDFPQTIFKTDITSNFIVKKWSI
jgi:hypothetical protein